MKIRHIFCLSVWRYLLMPEDTTAHGLGPACARHGTSALGRFKSVLWLLLAIITAMGMSHLAS